MSQQWKPSIYRTHDVQTGPPAPNEVGSLMQAVNEGSQRLSQEPYNPKHWTEHATKYLSLNYPELAAGDAHKALLLLDRLDSNLKTDPEKNDERKKAYEILGQALYDCHCHWEAAEIWDEASQRFPKWGLAKEKAEGLRRLLQQKQEAAAPLGGTPQEQRDRIKDGGVLTVQYPWMQERHMSRSPEAIALVNQELLNEGRSQTCYLARSTLATEPNDMLGMFAARAIQVGECILLDRTATATCSTPPPQSCSNCYVKLPISSIPVSCCSDLYCSTPCYDLALQTYHKPLCGQDFTWLTTPAKGITHNASPLRPLLMLRILATCVQADIHPLDHTLLARLQPLTNVGHMDVFTLTESIATPLRILTQLGVDIFTTPNFSPMVLHTIWTRLANNKAGSLDARLGFVDEITPHLPLFNHSCNPNVEWKREDGSTTVRFFARRNIRQDEELFCSYINVGDASLEERAELLWPWFEGPCLCDRCKTETVG